MNWPPLYVEPTAATSIFEAARLGDVSACQTHIESGTSLLETDAEERTAFHWACASGHVRVVQLMLDHKADPNVCDEDKWTPLMSASSAGKEDVVALLLSLPTFNSVDKINSSQCSALHYACSKQHAGVVALLVDHKANVNGRNNQLATPLHRAITGKSKDIVLKLIRAKANVNAGDREGNSPLHIAIIEQNTEMSELLLEHEAAMDFKNKQGKTPAELIHQFSLEMKTLFH